MDVAEASVMIVNHAERFGLSVLHQLRGRVGRSGRASKCFLVTAGGEVSQERLQLLVEEHDGMRIAQADLAHRCSDMPHV
jgi:ATP-dependent DNA helicase RecG